jgi:hypothetical protein
MRRLHQVALTVLILAGSFALVVGALAPRTAIASGGGVMLGSNTGR